MENFNNNIQVVFGGGNSKYNFTGKVARDILTEDRSWTIGDGGQV
jgi:hypothetical protein